MVRIGIIGTGGMAEYQAKKFAALEGCVLAACVDHKENHAEDFARRFSIPAWYSSLESMLGDGRCDAVTCVTLDSHHRRHSEQVLQRGLPLLCEKPLARTLAECRALVETARTGGAPNLVNFSKRNAPALSALAGAVASGKVGKPRSVEAEYLQSWVATGLWGDWLTVPRWKWRLLPELSTAGVVGDLGIHLVDALSLVLGNPIPGKDSKLVTLGEAMAAGRVNPRPLPAEFRAPGSADGTVPVEFEVAGGFGVPWEGATFVLRASWIAPDAVDTFRVQVRGTEGTLDLDLRRSKDAVFLSPKGGGPELCLPGPRELSTYERFVRSSQSCLEGTWIEAEEEKGATGIPTFARAQEVQKTLDLLLPGVLPL